MLKQAYLNVDRKSYTKSKIASNIDTEFPSMRIHSRMLFIYDSPYIATISGSTSSRHRDGGWRTVNSRAMSHRLR